MDEDSVERVSEAEHLAASLASDGRMNAPEFPNELEGANGPAANEPDGSHDMRFGAELAAQEELEEELLPDATQLAVAAGGALLVGVLYLLLPREVSFEPRWLPLVLELLLLAPPMVAAFFLEGRLPYRVARGLALALLGVLTLMLCSSVVLLVLALIAPLSGQVGIAGPDLLRAGALLWVVNILVFAVWYWEVDGEGPLSRLQALYLPADLLFPQQQNGNPTRWAPGFIDYLFVAFCFSTALSPADTAPLTRRLKVLMMAQAAISLAIIVLLVGRSVNILPQAPTP